MMTFLSWSTLQIMSPQHDLVVSKVLGSKLFRTAVSGADSSPIRSENEYWLQNSTLKGIMLSSPAWPPQPALP